MTTERAGRLDPLRSEAPLIVYLDVKSPYAFVAIKPTLELEARLGARFDWRPLTLDIPSYLGSARKKQGKVVKSQRSPEQWVAVRYAYRDTRRYAEAQGHVLRGTEKIWDSSIANLGICGRRGGRGSGWPTTCGRCIRRFGTASWTSRMWRWCRAACGRRGCPWRALPSSTPGPGGRRTTP